MILIFRILFVARRRSLSVYTLVIIFTTTMTSNWYGCKPNSSIWISSPLLEQPSEPTYSELSLSVEDMFVYCTRSEALVLTWVTLPGRDSYPFLDCIRQDDSRKFFKVGQNNSNLFMVAVKWIGFLFKGHGSRVLPSYHYIKTPVHGFFLEEIGCRKHRKWGFFVLVSVWSEISVGQITSNLNGSCSEKLGTTQSPCS